MWISSLYIFNFFSTSKVANYSLCYWSWHCPHSLSLSPSLCGDISLFLSLQVSMATEFVNKIHPEYPQVKKNIPIFFIFTLTPLIFIDFFLLKVMFYVHSFLKNLTLFHIIPDGVLFFFLVLVERFELLKKLEKKTFFFMFSAWILILLSLFSFTWSMHISET